MASLQQLISKPVLAYPDRPFIFTTYDTWSFQKVDRVSDQIACHLRDAYQKDVVILLKPSAVYYACLLACVKTGAIAVPIDVSLPVEQIDDFLKRINPAIFIASKDVMAHISEIKILSERDLLLVDLMVSNSGLTGMRRPVNTGVLVHRVFTSGSSGQPTLVSFNHETLLHDAIHTSAYYGFSPVRNIANLGRYTSSLGINGFWRALSVGTGFMTFDLKNVTLLKVWETIQNNDIQVIQGQPTLIGKLIEAVRGRNPNRRVRQIILGGEPMTHQFLDDVMALFPSIEKISYNYSSTETMLISAYTFPPKHFSGLKKIPVGTVAKDKVVEIVRDDGSLAHQGEIGQVVVRSKYLAAALAGQDADKRLILEDENSGIKCYFTGDMGRYNSQGLLEHYGRVDRQIKIQGVRIDPELVENKLVMIPGVVKCHVLTVSSSQGSISLVAAIIIDRDISDQQIIDALSPVLPLSHIPNHFIRFDEIPQNRSGKADLLAIRKAIENQIYQKEVTDNPLSEEMSQVRKFLISEWSRILGEQVVNVTHPIFHLGADSISIFEMTCRVNEEYKLDLNPSWVLKHSSINQQEEFIQSAVDKPSEASDTFTAERVRALLGWGKNMRPKIHNS
jgi:acyl-coenzyme A synthetase/AMP-(fatty) acid ligase/acyl carrier protein